MATETGAVTRPSIRVLTELERGALLEDPPAVMNRIARLFFRALETHNPLLASQLDRIKRRRLALSRLEFRAMRGALWEELHEKTFEQLLSKIEDFENDPSLLISQMDGRLTWIENASELAIADQARSLPEVFVKMECVLDWVGHGRAHDQAPGGISAIRRELIGAFFDALCCREPEIEEHARQTKQRLLALSPIRMRALRAGMWQAKGELPLSTIQAKLEGWFEQPSHRLEHLDQRLDAVEGLSSSAVEEQAALLPQTIVSLEEMLDLI